MSPKLDLPQVTLCAATSVNLAATIQAIARCVGYASFDRVLLFTDQTVGSSLRGVEVVQIPRLASVCDYSRFVLQDLVDWIDTSHCMIVQWDGFIIDPLAWDPAFLDCDYLGAPWPQFADGHNVGNGGFSLRSKRLMHACRLPQFIDSGRAEDVVIARDNRSWLELNCGLQFASQRLASRFSFERARTGERTFGFHGAFNLPQVLGCEGFWEVYATLDEVSGLSADFWPLLRQVASGSDGPRRAIKMIADRMQARNAA